MAAVLLTESPGGDPFAGVAPGPALAAALAEVTPEQLSGQHAAAWMRATFRQRNHDDAVLLRAVQEACRARADTVERVYDGEFAPMVAAAGLGWSETMASTRYMLAHLVFDRVPALGEAMESGYLEERKAAIFQSAMAGLADNQCARVVEVVLPEAGGLGFAALRERILEVARAVDPEWASERLAAAVACARVSARVAPSGAVDLTGHDLPPDLAQDAKLHLDALAKEVQPRLAFVGVAVGLGALRARLFLRLLDGSLSGADDQAVLDAVFTEFTSGPPASRDDGDDGSPGDDGPDDDGPDSGPSPASGPGPGPGPGSGSDAACGPDPGSDADPGPGYAVDGSGPSWPDLDTLGSPPTPSALAEPTTAAGERRPQSLAHRPGVAVRMRLSTLLGHDEHPAELPDVGGTTAGVARRVAADHGAATWQVLVHGEHDDLQHLLLLRAPPHAVHHERHRRRIVQITAPAAMLDALAHDSVPTDPWLAEVLAAHRRSCALDPEQHPATTTRDRDRRLPGAALARWIDARDDVCVHPGCRVVAARADRDHSRDWIDDGRTEADNLATLCRHDHRAKHEGGWRHEQPEPGRFRLTDPAGAVHHTRSRVVRPLPDPLAPDDAFPLDLLGREPPERPDYTARSTRDGRYTRESLATAAHLARRVAARAAEPETTEPDDEEPPF